MGYRSREPPPPTLEEGLHASDVGPVSKGEGGGCSQLTRAASGGGVLLVCGAKSSILIFTALTSSWAVPALAFGPCSEGRPGDRWLARHDGGAS